MKATYTGPLLREKYCETKRKRLWALNEDRAFFVDGQMFIIPKGYYWDGATVPRPLWFLFAPVGKAFWPAIVHDFLYETKGKGIPGYRHDLTRKQVDKIFLRQMIAEGVPKVQAHLMYWGVRTPIGRRFWNKGVYPSYLLASA